MTLYPVCFPRIFACHTLPGLGALCSPCNVLRIQSARVCEKVNYHCLHEFLSCPLHYTNKATSFNTYDRYQKKYLVVSLYKSSPGRPSSWKYSSARRALAKLKLVLLVKYFEYTLSLRTTVRRSACLYNNPHHHCNQAAVTKTYLLS